MKRAFVLLVSLILAGSLVGACSAKGNLKTYRPYEEPDARMPKEMLYLCPDYGSREWQCPFDAEPVDKVSFSGPLNMGAGGSIYEPGDYNYELFYDSLKLVDSVPPGADLYATTFYFSASVWGTAMRDALLCAAERGVNVRIIIGNPIEPNEEGDLEAHASTKETLQELIELSKYMPQLSVHGCTGGCLREGSTFDGKQHSKFFAISRACNGDSFDENIVGVSSNNWTSSLVKRDNATVFKREDPDLYGAFVRYFEDMVAAEQEGLHLNNYYDTPDGAGGILGTGEGTDSNYRYFLFPRSGGKDPVDELLRQVRCDDASEIRVSMSRWTTARKEIVDTLIRRAKKGCHVRVIVGDEPTEVSLRKYIVEQASELVDVPFEYRRLPSPVFHDKYFMIDAELSEGAGREKFVWSGSHNYSKSSLHTNEETALGIFDRDLDGDGVADNDLYEHFREHFEFQWARAALVGEFLPESDL